MKWSTWHKVSICLRNMHCSLQHWPLAAREWVRIKSSNINVIDCCRLQSVISIGCRRPVTVDQSTGTRVDQLSVHTDHRRMSIAPRAAAPVCGSRLIRVSILTRRPRLSLIDHCFFSRWRIICRINIETPAVVALRTYHTCRVCKLHCIYSGEWHRRQTSSRGNHSFIKDNEFLLLFYFDNSNYRTSVVEYSKCCTRLRW